MISGRTQHWEISLLERSQRSLPRPTPAGGSILTRPGCWEHLKKTELCSPTRSKIGCIWCTGIAAFAGLVATGEGITLLPSELMGNTHGPTWSFGLV